MTSLDQFKETFITECDELLADMESMLVELTPENATRDILDSIFRCAHSIKGGAGAFGLAYITTFTHSLEALLDELREGNRTATAEVVDILLKSCDVLKDMLDYARDDATPPDDIGKTELAELDRQLKGSSVNSGNLSEDTEVGEENPVELDDRDKTYLITFKPYKELFSTGNEPIFILRELASLGDINIICEADQLPNFDDLDPTQCFISWNITLKTEKPISDIEEVFEFVESECDLNITTQEEAMEKPPIPADETKEKAASAPFNRRASDNKASSSIRVDLQKVDRLVNMVGELVITEAMIKAQTFSLKGDRFNDLLRGVDELSQQARELQEAVMSVRMQPVHSIFSRMPRVVRDLSGQLGKKITLKMEGESTEVDKTVIEQLGDPLTHMIRNSIDHGIEKPDVRAERGKDETGTITLSASHESGRIVIRIRDDGNGVNREKVEEKAIANGLIPANHELTENQIDNLIFEPGFSTAAEVTNISGRGVGMDVVRRNIEALDGTVSVTNYPGKGSEFKVSLPLTLAVLDGMIVRVGEEQYIIPIINILETMRPNLQDMRNMEDNFDVINIRGEIIPTVRLDHIFNINNSVEDPSQALIVIVESSNDKMGVIVDELVGQQQVVIKNLEQNSDKIHGISGATILGDGKVSLILELSELKGLASRKLESSLAKIA